MLLPTETLTRILQPPSLSSVSPSSFSFPFLLYSSDSLEVTATKPKVETTEAFVISGIISGNQTAAAVVAEVVRGFWGAVSGDGR